MKIRRCLITVIFHVLMLAAYGYGAEQNNTEALKKYVAEFIEQKGHFDPAKPVPVYKLKPVDKESVRNEAMDLAKRIFPLFSQDVKRGIKVMERDGYYLVHGPDDLRIRAYIPSGFIYFERTNKIYNGQGMDISQDRAVDIATSFLTKNNLITVGPNERIFLDKVKRVKSQGISVKNEKTPAITNTIAVIFGRVAGDVKVVGPGSKVVVFIGEKGEVTGFQKKWRAVEENPVKEADTFSISRIVDSFVEELVQKSGGAGIRPQDVQLKMYDYGYLAQNKKQSQNFFQPVYVIGYGISDRVIASAQLFVYPAYDMPVEPIGSLPEEPLKTHKNRGGAK